jgi:MFS family permease
MTDSEASSVARLPIRERLPGNIFPLLAVMASATVYTVVQGLTYPLLALLLNERAVPEWLVGVNAAMMPLGMVVAAWAAPRIVARIGLYATGTLSLVIVSACVLAIGIVDSFWPWIPLRFLTGFLLSCIFVVTDTWVNELVEDRFRGRVIGFYSMLLSIGFAVGPAILTVLGSAGFLPFIIGAVLPLVATVPLVLARRRLTSNVTSELPASVLSFLWRAPTILACVVAAAFADQAAMSLLPIYALREGYEVGAASFSLTMMIVGSIALMYPIGWLADRYSRIKVVLACTSATTVLSALFPLAVGIEWLFFAVIFAWGGIYYAIYSLGLVRLGQQFSGADLVAGNAACGAMWGVGGILGTPLAGAAMGWFGPSGFPLSMVVAFGVLSIPLWIAARRS